MRVGVSVSLVGHAAVVLLSLLGVATTRKLQAGSAESIPVEIVTVGGDTQTKLGSRKGEAKTEAVLDKRPVREAETPREGPEKAKPSKSEAAAPPPPPPAEKPKPVAEAAPEPPPKAKPQPKPEPEPKKAEAPSKPAKPDAAEALPAQKPPPPKPVEKPETKMAEAKPAEPAPQPRPKPQAAKPAETRPPAPQPERSFDANSIAALLNKTDPAPAARPRANAENTASLGTAAGRNAMLTASEIDALKAKLAQCWNIPAGARDAESLVVRVRFSLSVNGSLNGAPELVDATPGPYTQVAAEAAMRAVRQCQPYSMLPAEKFDTWRDITVRFSPREMFGG